MFTKAVPAPANILCGSMFGSGTLLTIPANRTWQGWVTCNVASAVAASGSAVTSQGTVSTAGTGVTPAAGVILSVTAAVAAQGTAMSGQASNSDRIFVTIVAGATAATLVLARNSETEAAANAAGVLIA